MFNLSSEREVIDETRLVENLFKRGKAGGNRSLIFNAPVGRTKPDEKHKNIAVGEQNRLQVRKCDPR
jgi:hypothetical protein